ncbi:hypothetical protein DRN52_00290 [Thermococci archaeon]|nr:MAG: hypothetical protein DRN52_00290 [Thermococci archaeon]
MELGIKLSEVFDSHVHFSNNKFEYSGEELDPSPSLYPLEKRNTFVLALLSKRKKWLHPEIRNEEVKKICMEGNGGKPFLTPIGRRDLRGAFGVKLHPMLQGIDPSSEFLRPIYEWCQEEMAPLIVHLGFSRRGDLRFSDPLLIDPIASEYDFPIILAHMGSSRGFLWEKSKMVTLKNDNIILETSWAPKEVIKDALDEFGADRIIFGSDYPFRNPIEELRKVLEIIEGKKDRRLILWKNAHYIMEKRR